jgi:predicted transcriptional regulator YheO
MAKTNKTKDNYNVSYALRDNETHDDILCVNMNWENRSLEEVKNNLNTWLRAANLDLEVVDKK